MLTWLVNNDRHQLQQLIDVLYDISLTNDRDGLLDRILHGARTLVRAEAGTIYLKHGEHLIFQCVQNDTFQSQFAPEMRFFYQAEVLPISNTSISGYVAQTGKMLNVHDVYEINPPQRRYTFNRSYDEHTRYRTRSMLTLPLKNRCGDLLGVIQLLNARNQEGKIVPFFGTDLPFIRMFANIAVKVLGHSPRESVPVRSITHRSDALADKHRAGTR